MAVPAPSVNASDYMLGAGDKVKITVFNEPTLSGDFEVSSTGIISMPLIGDIQAARSHGPPRFIRP